MQEILYSYPPHTGYFTCHRLKSQDQSVVFSKNIKNLSFTIAKKH